MPPKKPAAKTPATVPSKATSKPKSKTAGTGTATGSGSGTSSKTKKVGLGGAGKPAVKTSGTASKGRTAAGTSTSKAKEPQKQEKIRTPQDEAACKIQTKVRQFLAKKTLQRKMKEKENYREMMEKLEREAYVKIAKMQQEEAERQRQKDEEERKRKREVAKRKKRMLEAAYDGDDNEITAVLKEVSKLDDEQTVGTDVIGRGLRARHLYQMVECEDANGNTPLSEAASGGHASTVTMLIERGADPNSRGQFQRTPLYRAAFAGHIEACQTLLQYGADPRLYAEDGQTPEQIASQPAVAELLETWDIEQTEKLIHKLEGAKQKRIQQEREMREAETSKLEEQVKTAESDYQVRQKQLQKATEEYNKRILEHDLAVESDFDRPELTMQAIHDAEANLEVAQIDLEKARDKLSQVKLQLREQQLGDESGQEAADHLPGLKVAIRELDEVLVRDVGNRIAESGKWPLIIDPSSQAATFLRYRDTNYFNALSPQQMQPEKIRLGVLGAVRYGKPLVLDMMEVEMFEACRMKFDEVEKGLLNSIMDKSIMQEGKYIKLIRKNDSEEYQRNKFNSFRTQNFKFYILTKNPFPPDSLVEATYPIRIHIPR